MFKPSAIDPSSDLAQRFLALLADIEGRTVDTDTLFEALRLEVLDWRLDHRVDAAALEDAALPHALLSEPVK